MSCRNRDYSPTMSMRSVVPPVVTPMWLYNRLNTGASTNENLVVLDTQWMPFTGGKSFYKAGHIPGALFFDLDHGVTKTREIPRNLPDPTIFENYVCSLGVSEDTHVVVYDHNDGDKITTASAARTWWLLRLHGHGKVSVLDGGFQQWLTEGLPLEKGENEKDQKKSAVGNFKVKLNTSLVKTHEEMRQIVSEKQAQIIDTRRPEHFTGQQAEPCEPIRRAIEDSKFPLPSKHDIIAGHMDGAINISFLKLTKPNSSHFIDRQKLSKLFEEVGVDLAKPLVTTCYIGHTACSLALAAAILGNFDTAVYYGSWTEWGQKTAKHNSNI